MADRQPAERASIEGQTAGAEPPDAVLDLGDTEPLVDLRDAPSIQLSGPSPGRAPLASGRGLAKAARTDVVERRDAIQQSRFIAVVLIAVLNMLDLVTTYIAISQGAHEANPIVAWMIESRAVVFAKVLICGSLLLGVVVARNRHRRVTLAGLCTAWAVVGVYSLVVVINSLSVWSRLG